MPEVPIIVQPIIDPTVLIKAKHEMETQKIFDTLNIYLDGAKMHKYWSDQETVIKRTIRFAEIYNITSSADSAKDLVNSINAIRGLTGNHSITNTFSGYEDYSYIVSDIPSLLSDAEKRVGKIIDGMSSKVFAIYGEVESLAKSFGIDITAVFEKLSLNTSNIDRYLAQIEHLNDEIGSLTSTIDKLQVELADLKSGNGIDDLSGK